MRLLVEAAGPVLAREGWDLLVPVPLHPLKQAEREFNQAERLARALALDPEILFLDEPTAGLDPIGAAAFDQLIGDLRHGLGLTVFMVTHDLDSLAAICDRIAVLVDQQLVIGTLAQLRQNPHPWIHDYFNGPRGRAAIGT